MTRRQRQPVLHPIVIGCWVCKRPARWHVDAHGAEDPAPACGLHLANAVRKVYGFGGVPNVLPIEDAGPWEGAL